MTQTIDKFLIDHGFEEQELKSLKHRSILYHAILFMSAFTLTFTGLAVAAWT